MRRVGQVEFVYNTGQVSQPHRLPDFPQMSKRHNPMSMPARKCNIKCTSVLSLMSTKNPMNSFQLNRALQAPFCGIFGLKNCFWLKDDHLKLFSHTSKRLYHCQREQKPPLKSSKAALSPSKNQGCAN